MIVATTRFIATHLLRGGGRALPLPPQLSSKLGRVHLLLRRLRGHRQRHGVRVRLRRRCIAVVSRVARLCRLHRRRVERCWRACAAPHCSADEGLAQRLLHHLRVGSRQPPPRSQRARHDVTRGLTQRTPAARHRVLARVSHERPVPLSVIALFVAPFLPVCRPPRRIRLPKRLAPRPSVLLRDSMPCAALGGLGAMHSGSAACPAVIDECSRGTRHTGTSEKAALRARTCRPSCSAWRP